MPVTITTVPLTLISDTPGDSPIFGTAPTFGAPYTMRNWHWQADISAATSGASWIAIFSSVIPYSPVAAEYPGFSGSPGFSYLPRAYGFDGAPPRKWDWVPVVTDLGAGALSVVNGPWVFETKVIGGAWTYYLTEAFEGGNPGANFRIADPLWLLPVDTGMSPLEITTKAGNVYFTPLTPFPRIVDYYFSAWGFFLPQTGNFRAVPAPMTITDARLLIVACMPNLGHIDALPGPSGIRHRTRILGSASTPKVSGTPNPLIPGGGQIDTLGPPGS